MNINLEYYKVFYYVGKLGGITAAAEALAISQPAVSQAVQHLEHALGVPLFVRTSKGVRFTSTGEMLYSYVSRGYEYIQTGEMKVLRAVNLEAGEIRIGASDMTLQFFLLPYLEAFHEKYPDIRVHVTNGPTPETLKFLQEGKIDFGIVSSPVPERPDMQTEAVKEIRDVFVAGKKFAYLRDRVLEYQDLERLPLICLERNTSTRAYVDQFLAGNGVQLEPEFELATSDMIVQFACRNLGIGSVMESFAAERIAAGELFVLQFAQEMPGRQFCLVTDQRNPLSTAAEKLIHMIHK